MIVVGLTGSIGMGKSTVAAQLERLGGKAISADAIVHALMRKGGLAVKLVEHSFPSVIQHGAVDRQALGKIVFNDPKKRELLESIIHPLVAEAEEIFVQKQQRLGAKFVVLDIPLLFEAGSDARVDITLVATAPYFIQRQRVLKRPNMTEEKFLAILANQMSDAEKQARADAIVSTGLGKASTMRQLKMFVTLLDSMVRV